MLQVPYYCQCLCGLICTYPNIYAIVKASENLEIKGLKGKPDSAGAGAIVEHLSCFCQKCCMPNMRSYEATLESPVGGEYKFLRPFSYGQCLCLPCCMPEVKVYSGSNHIGTVKMPYSPQLICTFEVDCYKGTDVNDVTRWLKIKKCAINCHTCCSKAWCGLCGKEL